MQDIYISIGQNIRRRRKEKHLTQESLAANVETSAQYISRIERGQVCPSLEFLYPQKEKRDLPGANRKPVFLRRYGLRLRRFLTNGRIPDDFHRKCLLPYALMPPAWMPSSR